MNRALPATSPVSRAERVAGALARRLSFGAAMLLVAACSVQPVKDAAQEPEARGAAEERESPSAGSATQGGDLSAKELTEDLLYDFLLAEIAGQRGELGVAARSYAELAKRTRDPRVARRATEVAIFARMPDAAIESARVWHETEPESTRALQLLAGLLINASRLEEALPYLRKLVATQGNNAGESFMQLARSLTNVKDKAAALRMMQELAAGYSELPQAHFAVAQAAFDAGELELAVKETRQAQSLRPDWEQAVLLEAQILQRRSPAEAAARLSRHLDKYPNSREVRLAHARVLLADKQFGAARSEFQKLMADYPTSTEVIYAVALLSIQLNDYRLAEENLRRLLELDYRDKDSIRLYLGQIAEEQKKIPEALDWYRQVQRGDQYIPAQVRYANLLARQGRVEEGRAHLRSIDPSSTQQRIQLILAEAQLLREAKREKEAFQIVEKALGEYPDQPDLLYDHAMLAERLDRLDVLEASLRRLIKIRPDHAHAYNALGYSLADRNIRLEEARQLIEQALRLAPNDYFIIDSMGWVLYRLGRLPEALKYLRQAYEGRPDAEIGAHLGEVLWKLGEHGEAQKIWREVSDKDPDNETLKKTIQRLMH